MFSGKYKLTTNNEGNIFLDRNGSTFICLVNYLRNNREELPQFETLNEQNLFQKELQFWDMKEDYKRFRKSIKQKEDEQKEKRLKPL